MGVIFSVDGDEDDRHDEGGESDTAQDDEGSDEDESGEDSDDDAGGGEGDESDDSDEGDGKGKGKSSSQQKKQQDEDDDEDVPSRKPKTPADFVALRRGKKIEKMSKAKDDGGQGGDGDDDDADDDDGDDKDTRSVVRRELSKVLKPLTDRFEQEEVENEIATFVQNNPDFKPFTSRVAKWSQHESWKGVPIEHIFYAAAGKNLLKIGAERSKKADNEAKKGRTGGSGGDEGGGRKTWSDAPLKEVGDEIERVKMGR